MYRKIAITTLILVILTAGCAAQATTAAPAPTAATAPTVQATLEPTPTSPPAPTETPAWSFSASDATGQEVTLANVPERIVSLAPSITEILFAVGAGDQVVGRDSYSDYPEQAAQAADIGGGYSELNTEAILALEPDLVLASELTSADQIKSIKDLNLTIFVVPNPTDFDGLYADLTLVGQMTGHADSTPDLINGYKARVAAVESTLADVSEKPLVFYELDGTDSSAPWTSGPGTFIDTLINMAGGRNVGASLQGDWVQISAEDLIVQNPDIILLGDATWGGMTPDMVTSRPGWDSISAVSQGQVYTFDDNLVSRPGPRLIDGLEAMARLLHPDLFK